MSAALPIRAAVAAAAVVVALAACTSPSSDEQLENRENSRVKADTTPSATLNPVPSPIPGEATPDVVEPLPGSSNEFSQRPASPAP